MTYKIIHTYEGLIYSGETAVEVSGFSSASAAVAAAEGRCLDFGGSYVVVAA